MKLISKNKLLFTKSTSLDLLELQGGTSAEKDTINVKLSCKFKK